MRKMQGVLFQNPVSEYNLLINALVSLRLHTALSVSFWNGFNCWRLSADPHYGMGLQTALQTGPRTAATDPFYRPPGFLQGFEKWASKMSNRAGPSQMNKWLSTRHLDAHLDHLQKRKK